MVSCESKKLTIAIWASTIVIILSTLLESAILLQIPDTLEEINKIDKGLDQISLSTQYEEHYLKNEIEILRAKVNNRITTHPNDEYAYYYLGRIQYQEGDFKKAYLNFKKASELDPTWERATTYMELSENR
ncbi:MAG: tetratricopeptide repeat protein [Agitococcus sp.]|nr:tetratricopeptide repeat protein [Agitococcus sp.]